MGVDMDEKGGRDRGGEPYVSFCVVHLAFPAYRYQDAGAENGVEDHIRLGENRQHHQWV